MNKKEIEAQLFVLRKKYNSTYARREVLKLKTSNQDKQLIHKKTLDLDELQGKIDNLEQALRNWH